MGQQALHHSGISNKYSLMKRGEPEIIGGIHIRPAPDQRKLEITGGTPDQQVFGKSYRSPAPAARPRAK